MNHKSDAGEDADTHSQRYLLVFRLNGSKLVLCQSDNEICNSTEKTNIMRRRLSGFLSDQHCDEYISAQKAPVTNQLTAQWCCVLTVLKVETTFTKLKKASSVGVLSVVTWNSLYTFCRIVLQPSLWLLSASKLCVRFRNFPPKLQNIKFKFEKKRLLSSWAASWHLWQDGVRKWWARLWHCRVPSSRLSPPGSHQGVWQDEELLLYLFLDWHHVRILLVHILLLP